MQGRFVVGERSRTAKRLFAFSSSENGFGFAGKNGYFCKVEL
jgi:hypothetical protein